MGFADECASFVRVAQEVAGFWDASGAAPDDTPGLPACGATERELGIVDADGGAADEDGVDPGSQLHGVRT